MSNDLVEKVAREMRNQQVDEYDPDTALYDDCHEAVKSYWCFIATAAIRVVLEEAAKAVSDRLLVRSCTCTAAAEQAIRSMMPEQKP